MTTNDQPQTIPADKVRAARDLHRDAAKMVTITDAEREIHQHVADAMEALLPHPDLPRMEWPRDTGIPGVAVGVPVTDPDLTHRISDEAPPGTIVVEANLSATVRNGRYWHSAEEAHLTLAEALFYAPHEWDAIAPITVVRWGE